MIKKTLKDRLISWYMEAEEQKNITAIEQPFACCDKLKQNFMEFSVIVTDICRSLH